MLNVHTYIVIVLGDARRVNVNLPILSINVLCKFDYADWIFGLVGHDDEYYENHEVNSLH